MTDTESKHIKEISRKLDQVVALLKILAKKELGDVKKTVISTSKKEQIYELCDGRTETSEIAKKSGVTRQYLYIALKELEDAGLILTLQEGARRFPEKVL